MADDSDDDRPAVPTFSDGSYLNKGSKLNAHASRISASKNANAVASRASAIMMASMQQLNNTKHPIVNSHQPITKVNNVNKAAILAAEKRSQYILENIKKRVPENNLSNINIKEEKSKEEKSKEEKSKEEKSKEEKSKEEKSKEEKSKEEKSKESKIHNILPRGFLRCINPHVQEPDEQLIEVSDIYNAIVSNTYIKKKVLLETYEHTPPKVFKNTKRINLVHCRSPEKLEADPVFISTLSVNLLNILNNVSDPNEIINEFNRHMIRVRISLEELIHKSAVENSRIIKNTYLTSDT